MHFRTPTNVCGEPEVKTDKIQTKLHLLFLDVIFPTFADFWMLNQATLK